MKAVKKIRQMDSELNAEKIVEEYEKRITSPVRPEPTGEIKIFKDAVNAIENNEYILETIFDFMHRHHNLIIQLTLDQWLAIKNYFEQRYESISFLILMLEIAKNVQVLLIKEITLFVANIIHKNIATPVTRDDFFRHQKEDLNFGKAEEMLRKYPATKKKVEILYKRQLDERLMLTHQYLTEMLRIRLETQVGLTGISAPFNEVPLNSKHFREDLDESQRMELKDSMTKLARSSYDFIRSAKVFLQYAYATEKENFSRSTAAEALAARTSFYAKIDSGKAFNYLEQAKSALFLERLSFKTGYPRQIKDKEINRLIHEEQCLKKDLLAIFTADKAESFEILSQVSGKRKRLAELYQELRRYPYPELKDYIDLRRGLAIEYEAMKRFLCE